MIECCGTTVLESTATVAGIFSGFVLVLAAFATWRAYKRNHFDNIPDVTSSTYTTIEDNQTYKTLSFALDHNRSKSVWEITRVEIGRRRHLWTCFLPWKARKSWERRIELSSGTTTAMIYLYPVPPDDFPITYHIRRVAHYKERATLETWHA